MAEKKNLVIKVKYPTATKASKAAQPNAAVITVWNVQRIALAAGVLLGLIVLIVYAFSGEDTETVAAVKGAQVSPGLKARHQARTAPPIKSPRIATASSLSAVQADTQTINPKPVITPQASVNTQAQSLSKEPPRVRRALLVTSITDKEPANEIIQSVRVQPAKLVTVYYFNELRGMNGKILYHEWLRNGVSVVKEPLQVGADRWRVSSHKTFDDKGSGNWTVKLIDGSGNVLDEKNFAVSVGQ